MLVVQRHLHMPQGERGLGHIQPIANNLDVKGEKQRPLLSPFYLLYMVRSI